MIIVGERLRNLAALAVPVGKATHASVDVTLSSTLMVQRPNMGKPIDLANLPEEHEMYGEVSIARYPYIIAPGEFFKATLAEHIFMPNDVVAMFTLRSRMAQVGLEQSTSVWIRPNWSGVLVLELTNLSKSNMLVSAGLAVGQLHFFDADDSVL